jgi:hypothetical protein
MTFYDERARPRTFGDLRSIIQAGEEFFEPDRQLLEEDPAASAYYGSYLSRHPEVVANSDDRDLLHPYLVQGKAVVGYPAPWAVALVITDLLVNHSDVRHGGCYEGMKAIFDSYSSYGSKGKPPLGEYPSVRVVWRLAMRRFDGRADHRDFRRPSASIQALIHERCSPLRRAGPGDTRVHAREAILGALTRLLREGVDICDGGGQYPYLNPTRQLAMRARE